MRTLALVALAAVLARADEDFIGQVGKHAVGILESADRVETFRTLAERDEDAKDAVDGYPVVKKGPEKDAAFAKRILGLLRHEDTGPNELECRFVPHDAFRVWRGKEHVDILLCYHCEQVQVTSYPPQAPGPIRALGDFEQKAGPWFALSREAFPDDASLRRMEAAAAGPSKQVREFLGEKVVAVLENLEDVEIYRIRTKEKHAITGPRIEDQEILGRSEESVDDLRLDLKGALFDGKTYRFESRKLCAFEPGVAFRLHGGEHGVVEVLVCFSCDEVMLTWIPDGDEKPEPKHEDCDGARDAFLRIAKAAFPGDEKLQGLKEQPGGK